MSTLTTNKRDYNQNCYEKKRKTVYNDKRMNTSKICNNINIYTHKQ